MGRRPLNRQVSVSFYGASGFEVYVGNCERILPEMEELILLLDFVRCHSHSLQSAQTKSW